MLIITNDEKCVKSAATESILVQLLSPARLPGRADNLISNETLYAFRNSSIQYIVLYYVVYVYSC